MSSRKQYSARDIKKKRKKYNDEVEFNKFESSQYSVEDDYMGFDCESSDYSAGDENKEDAVIEQEPNAFSFVDQESTELIWIKDSCDIEVTTTDTQVAVQLQVAIQVALGVVISILSANVANSEVIAQDLLAHANLEQTNKQKIVIVNSKDVKITTTDVDAAVNIQVAVQALIAVFVSVLSS
ncbi:spore coat protein X [Priestia aryabhattai]|uniref:spore coat protein n=1 Tax=Priestia aryabhattai TaxID=412384 RepID=UPI000B506DEB|nr:spore coat protein [Priestia aryabhattai]OVE34072.1 spore coat protein X [Priestia aryabhattai]